MVSLVLVVCVYLVVTLLVSGGMLALQPLTGIEPDVLSLVQFGPAAGALVTWFVFRARIAGVWPPPVSRARFRFHLALAVAACALYAGVLVLVTVLQGEPLAGAHALGGVPFAAIVVVQFVGAMGEEIGWRGFLQPLLESMGSRLVSCLVVGVLWGAWHVQIFAAGAVIAIGFLTTTVLLSILMGYLGTGVFAVATTVVVVFGGLALARRASLRRSGKALGPGRFCPPE